MAAPAWAMAETTAAVGFDSNLPRAPRRLHGVLVASSRSRNTSESRAAPQFCPSAPRSGLLEKGTLTLLLPSTPYRHPTLSSLHTFARARRASSRCRPASLQLHSANGSPRRSAALAASCRVSMPASTTAAPSSLPVSCLPPPLPSPQPQPSLLPPSSGTASSRGGSPCARARRCRCRRSPCTGCAAARART